MPQPTGNSAKTIASFCLHSLTHSRKKGKDAPGQSTKNGWGIVPPSPSPHLNLTTVNKQAEFCLVFNSKKNQGLSRRQALTQHWGVSASRDMVSPPWDSLNQILTLPSWSVKINIQWAISLEGNGLAHVNQCQGLDPDETSRWLSLQFKEAKSYQGSACTCRTLEVSAFLYSMPQALCCIHMWPAFALPYIWNFVLSSPACPILVQALVRSVWHGPTHLPLRTLPIVYFCWERRQCWVHPVESRRVAGSPCPWKLSPFMFCQGLASAEFLVLLGAKGQTKPTQSWTYVLPLLNRDLWSWTSSLLLTLLFFWIILISCPSEFKKQMRLNSNPFSKP